MNQRFLINRRDAKVMGVAAGLADYSGVDPTIVRLAFVALALVTGPMMIAFYTFSPGCSRPTNKARAVFAAGDPSAIMPA